MRALDLFGDAVGRVVDGLRRSTAQVAVDGADAGAGAGVVWRADGLVVTNAHVARGGATRVRLADGRELAGRVVSRDVRRDLAAIAVAATGLETATPGDARGLRAGDLVVAVGHPMSVPDAAAVGVLHAPLALRPGRRAWVAADVRLAPGNSGGPLADAEGRVLGLNTMIANGLALAVPTQSVERFLRRGRRAPLGVTVRPVVTTGAGGPAPALLVTALEPGSAAEAAGLLPGDLLVGAAGAPFPDHAGLADALAECEPGDTIPLAVVRGGRELECTVVVRPRPQRSDADAGDAGRHAA
jgi:serine protease Do